MKLIFMGSPPFAVPSLEALHASHHQIAAVVTRPDRPSGRKLILQQSAVKGAAHRLNLPVLQPSTTKTQDFVTLIRSFEPDILVVVAFGEILRPQLLESAPLGAVNLHASLLPKYRGASPIAWAILNGESVTGASTMFLNEAMDAGPVLLQEPCAISASDTTESLTQKIATIGAPLLKRTIDLIEKEAVVPIPQDTAQASFAPRLTKEDGWIDWTKPSNWISRQIRAFNPWPGSFTAFRNHLVKFWLAHPLDKSSAGPPGTIIHISRHAIEVACGGGTVLQILEVQPQNRPRFTAADFVNGYRPIENQDRFTSNIS